MFFSIWFADYSLLLMYLQIFANVLLISNGSLVDVTLDVHLPVVLCPVGSQPELPLIFSYLIVHQQIRNAPVTSSPPNTASCLLLKMMISTIKYLFFPPNQFHLLCFIIVSEQQPKLFSCRKCLWLGRHSWWQFSCILQIKAQNTSTWHCFPWNLVVDVLFP